MKSVDMRFARFIALRVLALISFSTDYGARSKVDVTAYRDGAKLVLVAVNRNLLAATQTFTLWNGTVGTFTPYVTSSSKNCELQGGVSFKNGTFSFTLEPLSVTTFVLN